jgi:hypothetical protein
VANKQGIKIVSLAAEVTTRMQRFALLLIFIAVTPTLAQEAIPARPSPLAIASCLYKDTYLKIVYSQPHKKGREIFGKLVPYEQVWRAGANEATEITVTRDVFVAGQLLPAGTYSLLAIPYKDNWVIIFNRDVGQWGSYNYNEKNDALRVVAPVTILENNVVFEPFTIKVDQNNNKATILFIWDRTQASLNVDFIEPRP